MDPFTKLPGVSRGGPVQPEPFMQWLSDGMRRSEDAYRQAITPQPADIPARVAQEAQARATDYVQGGAGSLGMDARGALSRLVPNTETEGPAPVMRAAMPDTIPLGVAMKLTQMMPKPTPASETASQLMLQRAISARQAADGIKDPSKRAAAIKGSEDALREVMGTKLMEIMMYGRQPGVP